MKSTHLSLGKIFFSCVMLMSISCRAQAISNHHLGEYFGIFEGRILTYSYIPTDRRRRVYKVTIECQQVKQLGDHLEALFVRTFYDEPLYLEIYPDKIVDESLGGVILYSSSNSGDIIEIHGEKTKSLLAKIKIISINKPQVISKKTYNDCAVLEIIDYDSDTIQKRIYAYGVGLIYEKDYMNVRSPRLIGELILKNGD